jgi:hypothetical protein
MATPTRTKLSNEDLNKLKKAKEKLFQTRFGINKNYSTDGTDLMASPIKQSSVYIAIIILAIYIFRKFGMLKFLIRLDHLYIYCIILVFLFFYLYITQYILNSNIEYISERLGYIPTYHELEGNKPNQNNSILNDLWRIMLGHLLLDFILFNFTKPQWFNKASENYLHVFRNH